MAAPWMPLYVADYLADTGHLSAAEHGAYMLLIMHYWRQGSLPADEAHLQRIARMTAAEWRRSRDTIAAFFQDGWKHARIDHELTKSGEKSARRADAGSRGGKAKAEKAKSLKSNKPTLAKATILLEQKDADALASSSQPHSLEELRSSMKSASAPDAFVQWYTIWPHKVGRSEAEKAFTKICLEGTVGLDTLMAGVDRYKRDKPADREWMNPATWLNGRRWLDAPTSRPPPDHQPRGRPPDKPVHRNGYFANLARSRSNDPSDNHPGQPPSDTEQPGHGPRGSLLAFQARSAG